MQRAILESNLIKVKAISRKVVLKTILKQIEFYNIKINELYKENI